MKLARAVASIRVVGHKGDLDSVDVISVEYDSRRVCPGALFCCVPGLRRDGHDFAGEAVARGASALLVERILPLEVPQVVVERGSVRHAMAIVAAEQFGRPSEAMRVIGVTGTNGKTTVAHMLRAVLERCGLKTAVLGTIGASMTTPEAPVLQRKLAEHREAGGAAVAMEVSSHALDQSRVDGIRFAVAIFTNLSQDHLDYHGTMEAYFSSKSALFEAQRSELGVINADDPWGRRLLRSSACRVRPYSLGDVSELSVGLERSSFVWQGQQVQLQLGGLFNVSNAVAAITAARELDLEPAAIASGISSLLSVPGRMEAVHAGQPFTVLVDFAHTPAGLAEVLAAARQGVEPGGRLMVVFGCGGERDAAKRPRMGEVASELADLAVVTSDNPRGEDPLAIIADIMSGVRAGGKAAVQPDRATAVAVAVQEARPGDVLVIAGKGHESSQELADRSVAMDDRDLVRSAVEATRGARR